MTESRSNQIQREKMTALLKAELAAREKEPEVEVIDLRALFPRRDDRERVTEAGF